MNILEHEIPYLNPLAAFYPFASQPYALFLDSAQTTDHFGRYSYIATDPFLTLTSKNGQIMLGEQESRGNPFLVLQEQLSRFPLTHRAALPPFQTGVAGYFGYDLGHHVEQLPRPRLDDMQFPDLMVGFYDVIIAFDHLQRQAWILSSGYPEIDAVARNRRAQARIQDAEERLARVPANIAIPPMPIQPPAIECNFDSRGAYERAVGQVIDYITAGDILQVNLSQRFRTELLADDTPFKLYQRLRAINPAPFAAYLNFGEVVIASASPERFILLTGNLAETRPIKGTRPRGATEEDDQKLAAELLSSEKDRTENIITVDVLRSEFSRVCQEHTVKTPEICVLESFATVHHLVSTVVGRLNSGVTAIDLLQATFPGGSITGAPKTSAMEIITELEPTQRGPYCGSVGYVSFSGGMDTSITIRTYAIKDNQVTFQAGGGITAASNPVEEYDETLDKARALIDALGTPELAIK